MTSRREEDYLEAIWEIVSQKHYAKVNDVAKLLGVGQSSVTEMFQRLSAEELINYEKYSGVTMTKKGMKIINELLKKHETLKEFLLILGVENDIAEAEACKIEHVVEDETIKKLIKFVEFVRSRKENPLWLEHFKHYEKTGELVKCTIKCEGNCQVHKGAMKQKK